MFSDANGFKHGFFASKLGHKAAIPKEVEKSAKTKMIILANLKVKSYTDSVFRVSFSVKVQFF